MRKTIFEYLELSKSEKTDIWNTAVFVFDTNVYLNLYRYSKRTSSKFIDAMESFKEKIWMPQRVAQEFAKNRIKVILDTIQNYEKVRNNATVFTEECKKTLNIKNIDGDTKITELQNYITTWIDNYQKDNLVISELSNDMLLERILSLYEGKVGKEYDKNELKEIYSEGDNRYKDKTPPGYKDADKEEKDEKYGDLIVWKQILQYAQNEKKNIIFVTNDVKEDWWEIVNGKKIGPRIELKKEFHEATGMKFYMYNDIQFITLFQENKSEPIDKNVVNEMETVNEYNDLKERANDLYYSDNISSHRLIELQIRIQELERQIEDYEHKIHKIRNTNNKREEKLNLNNKKIEYLQVNDQPIPPNILKEQINTRKNYEIGIATEQRLIYLLQAARKELNKLREERNSLVHGLYINE